MNFSDRLGEIIQKKNSMLCVGLDSDMQKLPPFLGKNEGSLLAFNRAIIDATAPFAAAFKINLAFYEALGVQGWRVLEQTFEMLPDDVVAIADAKRGDIGNTAQQYARALFDGLKADAVTVSPYMGYDSIEPFLNDPEKGVFVLCLTSNSGRRDFQFFSDGTVRLYERVALKVNEWNERGNCGLVVGASQPEELATVRRLVPELPLLIPGIGAQGGDLEAAVAAACVGRAPVIFNSSRAVIYASSGPDFAEAAAAAAQLTRDQLNTAKATIRGENDNEERKGSGNL